VSEELDVLRAITGRLATHDGHLDLRTGEVCQHRRFAFDAPEDYELSDEALEVGGAFTQLNRRPRVR